MYMATGNGGHVGTRTWLLVIVDTPPHGLVMVDMSSHAHGYSVGDMSSHVHGYHVSTCT